MKKKSKIKKIKLKGSSIPKCCLGIYGLYHYKQEKISDQDYACSKYILNKMSDFENYYMQNYKELKRYLENMIIQISQLFMEKNVLYEKIELLNQENIANDGSVDSLRQLRNKNQQLENIKNKINMIDSHLLRYTDTILQEVSIVQDEVKKAKCQLCSMLESYLWGARIKIDVRDFLIKNAVYNLNIIQTFENEYAELLEKLYKLKKEVI